MNFAPSYTCLYDTCQIIMQTEMVDCMKSLFQIRLLEPKCVILK